jgi:hypothetical protein
MKTVQKKNGKKQKQIAAKLAPLQKAIAIPPTIIAAE